MALFDPKTTTLKIRDVDSDVVAEFEDLCRNRGLEQEQMFRVMVRSFCRRKVTFDLHEELNFGKYNGLRLEEVIRADPQYINWLLEASSWFRISAAAERLLVAMGQED